MKCYTLHADGTVSPGIVLSPKGGMTWHGLQLHPDDLPEVADGRVISGEPRFVTIYLTIGHDIAKIEWDNQEAVYLGRCHFDDDERALVSPDGVWQPVAPTERIGPGSGLIIVRHGEECCVILADGQTYALIYDPKEGLQVTPIASAD